MTSGLKGQKREWDPLELQIVENCLANAGDLLGSSTRAPSASVLGVRSLAFET